jgi:hypothetical protein
MWGMYGAILAQRRAKAKELVKSLPGMKLDEALKQIKDAGLKVQLLSVDGTVLDTDKEFVTDRLGLVVANGVITGAQIG